MKILCRGCDCPLFGWEMAHGLCRKCAIADVEPAAFLRRRDDANLVMLTPRPIDRLRQLISNQLPPTRLRMVRQFIVKRKDGTRETIELNVPKVNPITRQVEGREDRKFIITSREPYGFVRLSSE